MRFVVLDPFLAGHCQEDGRGASLAGGYWESARGSEQRQHKGSPDNAEFEDAYQRDIPPGRVTGVCYGSNGITLFPGGGGE